MKKLWSLFLACIMMLGCSISAFADQTAQHVITITNEKSGHVYEAYQIFKGDLDSTNMILSNIEWGTGVNGDDLLASLKEQDGYRDCESAADVAEILKNYENDSKALDEFAVKAEQFLTAVAAGTSAEEQSPYKISVTGDGYYLIKDKNNPGTGDAYTKYILQVVRDIQVEAKADVPTLEHHILENGSPVETNSVSVGDVVEYVITSKVPDMNGYEKYFFLVHDTLAQGFTFQADSMSITIGDQQLTGSDYQIVTQDLADDCSFEIIFKNFIQYKEKADAVISISYSALVNTNAVIGVTGNANKAHLQYSNNPNVKYNGSETNPDKPGPDEVIGMTPDEVTISYLTGIELTKIDDSETAVRLQGAEFKIRGEKLNQVKVKKGVFREDENGTYYKLKDGTYTQTAPIEATMDRYESTERFYVYEDVTEWITVTEEVGVTAMVGLNGEVQFHGLAAGTYVIEEVTAPNGYNLLSEPIQVEIQLNAPDEVTTGDEAAEWKYTVSGAMTQEEKTAENGIVQLSVVNKAGIVLPSTGGAGVYAFYVIGICLAIAAIIADKRKNRKLKD